MSTSSPVKNTSATPESMGERLLDEVRKSKPDKAKAFTLIRDGAKLDCKTSGREYTITFAYWHGHNDIVIEMVQHGADVNTVGSDGQTAFLYACAKGDMAFARELVSLGADIHAQNKHGENAIILLLPFGRTALMDNLLKKGVDPAPAIERLKSLPAPAGKEAEYAALLKHLQQRLQISRFNKNRALVDKAMKQRIPAEDFKNIKKIKIRSRVQNNAPGKL